MDLGRLRVVILFLVNAFLWEVACGGLDAR